MSTLASVTIYDLFTNRPSAGIPGRLFFASDTGAGYYDDGSTWHQIVSVPGLMLLEEHTASSSSELDFTTCFTSAYDDYDIRIVDLVVGTAGATIELQCSTNGGSSYDTGSNYAWAVLYGTSGGGSGINNADSDTAIQLRNSGGSGAPGNPVPLVAAMSVQGPLSAAAYKSFHGTLNAPAQADVGSGHYADICALSGVYKSTTAVNAFRLLPSTGNFASGTVRVYGRTK